MGAVYAVGTINADFTMRLAQPVEQGSDLVAHGLLRGSGGRAGNVAVAARRLGAAAQLLGCVGSEDLAEQALAGPRAAGVEIERVQRTSTATGVTTVLVPPDGSSTMIYAPGANRDFDAGGFADAPRGSAVVADAELGHDAIGAVLEAAHSRGLTTILDPTGPDPPPDRLLALADHLTPNAREAKRLTGVAVATSADAQRAAQRLRERGAEHVYVKLPHGGCVAVGPHGDDLVEAPDGVEVADTTGAGDAFAAALAVALIQGRAPAAAALDGVAAAACAVTVVGAQPALPDRTTLDATAARIRAAMRR